MKTLRVLVACEFSGVVRRAFERRGHHALSVDLLPADDGAGYRWSWLNQAHSGHWQGDIVPFLTSEAKSFDIMIAHPPCTYLANSGVRWLYEADGTWNLERCEMMEEAASFFRLLLDAPIPHVAVENPIMHRYGRMRVGTGQDQLIQPWQFGHPESKATCLWLRNLPKLEPTRVVEGREQRMWKLPPSKDRGKLRSVTYLGFAEAMADQWGAYVAIETCQAVVSARNHGDDYARYIATSIREHIAKGNYTLEYATSATLGDMLAGNDGE